MLAVKPEEQEFIEQLMLEQFGITKVTAIVEGGDERQDSVEACIESA